MPANPLPKARSLFVLIVLAVALQGFGQTKPNIDQQAKNANCSNIVASGNTGTVTVTCRNVDKKLADQIGQLVADSKRDGKTLKDISGKLEELLNGIRALKPKVVASRRIQEQASGANANWSTKFLVATDIPVSTANLRIVCSGAVLGGGISSSGVLALGYNGPDPADPKILLLEVVMPENLVPGRPLGVLIFSKNPITILSGTIGGQQIDFSAQ